MRINSQKQYCLFMCLVERKIVMMSFISKKSKTLYVMFYIKTLKRYCYLDLFNMNIELLQNSKPTWSMLIIILRVSQSYTLYFLLIKKPRGKRCYIKSNVQIYMYHTWQHIKSFSFVAVFICFFVLCVIWFKGFIWRYSTHSATKHQKRIYIIYQDLSF